MGIMERFEQNIERVVNGAFARAFRSSVQPVELSSGLRREVDSKAVTVARDRVIIPNAFTITLAEDDYERFHSSEEALVDELSMELNEHARQQRYTFAGPIMIRFQNERHLETGVFHIVSSQHRESPAKAPVMHPNQAQPSMQAPHRATPERVTRPVLPGQHALLLNGRSHPLEDGVTVLGRGSDADVLIDDTGVSRHHAQVRVAGGALTLEDLGSTNGTFVNGRRVQTMTIQAGDEITIGRVTLQVIPPHQGGSRAP